MVSRRQIDEVLLHLLWIFTCGSRGLPFCCRAPVSDGSDMQFLSHVTVSVTAVEWGIYQQKGAKCF